MRRAQESSAAEAIDTPLAYAFLESTDGMSQAAQATIAGVKQSTISLWEKARAGKQPIRFKSAETRSKLQDYLLADSEMPGFREGVAFALATMREPFEALEARLRANVSAEGTPIMTVPALPFKRSSDDA